MSSPDKGLYRDAYERDSCGFGLIANLDDQPSHWLVQTAITSLNRLTHRGAIAGDGKTGDGCGLLLKRPEAFLRAIAGEAGIELTERFASGLVFLSRDPGLAQNAREILEAQLVWQGLELAGWRKVPIDSGAEDAAAHRADLRELQPAGHGRGLVQPQALHGAPSRRKVD
jgi:glutamate synthase (NADPH/NADH) large chain